MAWFKIRKNTPIFPLSCNPKLSKEELTGIDIFFDHLKYAFKSPRIRNIAITGPFGVGKSSIIRSFNDQYISPIKKRKRFLYINLGDYANAESPNAGTKPVPGPAIPRSVGGSGTTATSNCPCKQACANAQAEPNSRNAVERRLLMQIYAAFNPQKFPYSCFRQVPKAPGILKTSLFMLFAMALLLLLLKAPLADLLLGWTPQWPNIQTYRNCIIEHHPFLEVVLYGIVLLGAAVLFFRGFRFIIPKMKASRLALKLTNAEMDLEKDSCEDYLDQYTQELIYCLNRIHKKIDNTVVFEDMDRLSDDICISIFTRLREINHILNAHLGGSKYVRFVFVINDRIANQLECNKFFDYILPVIPMLNQASAASILKKNLTEINRHLETACRKERQMQKVGCLGHLLIKLMDRNIRINLFFCSVQRKLCADMKSNRYTCAIGKWIEQCIALSSKHLAYPCFHEMVNDGRDGVLVAAAPYLIEYRKQYSILNEYALVVRLYHRNNPNRLTCNVLEGIFAFLIYKHLWPEDYTRCIAYEKNVLSGRTVQEAAGNVHQEFLQHLLDSNMLNIRSFHYAGFSQDVVNKLWEKKLRAGTKEMQCQQIRDIQADDHDYIEILKDFCQAPPDQSDCCPEEVLAEAISCILLYRAGETQEENDWFFKNRDIRKCFSSLSLLNSEICEAFIEWCKGLRSEYDVFSKCVGAYDLAHLHDGWTSAYITIYQLGVSVNNRPNAKVYLTDTGRYQNIHG